MRKYAEKMNVGMVGIGGSGMRGLAYLLSQAGANVYGMDDMGDQSIKIADDGVNLMSQNEFIDRIRQLDQVIFTDAIPPEHPARLAAGENGELLSYYEAVGRLAQNYRTVAITGTHGKSSTCAMIAHILVEAGLDPTVLIGAAMPEWEGRHARKGHTDLLLLEADEYREHFLTLSPHLAAITTIDFDHPDYYQSMEQTENAFSKFLGRLQPGGKAITLQSVKNAHANVLWPEDVFALDDQLADKLQLNVPGRHMRLNGLIALAVAVQAGVGAEDAAKYLSSYGGIKRRFEFLGKWDDLSIISDYGHHPTEIAKTLEGAREKYPNQKIVAIFEPHTQERMELFAKDFVKALSIADGVIQLPVYQPLGRVSKASMGDKEKHNKEKTEIMNNLFSTVKEDGSLKNELSKAAQKFNIAILFSAGSADQQLRELLDVK
jgi:UDP-N-acetylmuramate--alanine ligase